MGQALGETNSGLKRIFVIPQLWGLGGRIRQEYLPAYRQAGKNLIKRTGINIFLVRATIMLISQIPAVFLIQ
jgi:hypothetical protein